MNKQEEVDHLTKRCYLLADALVRHCRYKMIMSHLCTFFDEGPRYRQECSLTACPILEKKE